MIFAKHIKIMELAHRVIKDITLKELSVSEMKSLVLLTLVARPGTGTTKNVCFALPDGSSTPMASASPSMTSAPHMMNPELAHHAIRDTTLKEPLA